MWRDRILHSKMSYWFLEIFIFQRIKLLLLSFLQRFGPGWTSHYQYSTRKSSLLDPHWGFSAGFWNDREVSDLFGLSSNSSVSWVMGLTPNQMINPFRAFLSWNVSKVNSFSTSEGPEGSMSLSISLAPKMTFKTETFKYQRESWNDSKLYFESGASSFPPFWKLSKKLSASSTPHQRKKSFLQAKIISFQTQLKYLMDIGSNEIGNWTDPSLNPLALKRKRITLWLKTTERHSNRKHKFSKIRNEIPEPVQKSNHRPLEAIDHKKCWDYYFSLFSYFLMSLWNIKDEHSI